LFGRLEVVLDKVSEHLRNIVKLPGRNLAALRQETLVELGELTLSDGSETQLRLNCLVDCERVKS
jgi:hypothetical protein